MNIRASCLLKKLKLSSSVQVKWSSSKAKFKLKEDVEKLIEDNEIKPRKHPGIIKTKMIEMPKWIIEAMNQSLDDSNRPQLLQERSKFSNYLFSRRLPLDEDEYNNKYLSIEEKILEKKNHNLSEEEIEDLRKKIKGEVNYKLKQNVFAWKSMEYTSYRSLLYMITRSTPEYAVLYTIFKEIQSRDPDFNPQTMFDFGSGVGSVLWAAIQLWKHIGEYLAVDISNHMNDLSQKIIEQSPSKFKGFYYRQYLPVSDLKHDLVVSAYSLMELHNTKSRLEVISKLWNKTNKYLVIVEQGTNAGFKLVNEARDFIAHIMGKQDPSYFTFAPCPHDMECPRYKEGKYPCNFVTNYRSLPLLGPSNPSKELYSYIVLKKGERTENDNWSRVVRPILLRSKHVLCRMCTPSGKLEEIVFTAGKYGKPLYRCAKSSRWGDRLPIQPNSEYEKQSKDTEQELNSEDSESEEQLSFENESKTEHKEENVFYSDAPVSTKRNDNL